jgi:predicted permease
LAALAARLLKLPPPARRAFAFATGLQNYGYLPLPLVLALFPRDTAGVLFTHNLGVEIALWTVGMWILGGTPGRKLWRKIFNPPLCALFASIALNAFDAASWIPAFLLTALDLVAQSAIPLALLLTGAMLADLVTGEHAGGFLNRKWALTVAGLVRLAIMPLLLLALGRWLPLSRELREIVIVQAAMPAAMMPIILARHYGADSNLAVGIVLTTTAVSLLTIPAWLRFGTWWLGG